VTLDDGASLQIQERFVSIQGEGTLVGTPSSFLRTTGCNLRCSWCDSPDSSWTPKGVPHDLEELVAWCASGPRHVVLTGGEPMLHAALAPLSRRLRAGGHHVTIETAGTRILEGLECDLMSLSPKLANSTPWERAPQLAERHEAQRIERSVLGDLMRAYPWQLKFVVAAEDPRALARDLGEIDGLLALLALPRASRDRVLLMPEAVTREALTRGYAALLNPCRARGFRLGQRLHIELFGHRPGT
jgi:7-carboxy-7-deazaguanine synthase